MYSFIHGILADRKGGELFKCFGAWHFVYIFLTIAAAVFICLRLKGKDLTVKRCVSVITADIAFGLYIADFFLMPLAYGEIDIEKLPFHVCTAMCVMCFLSRHVKALEKYRTSFALLGLLSNFGYLVFPAGVMWHAVNPMTYRVIQTLVFHGVMTVYGVVTLVYDNDGFKWKNLRRELCVIALMIIWAVIGNALYCGTDGAYSHDFNWFFVTKDPFGILDRSAAPFIMPLINLAMFFTSEAAIYGVYHAFKRKKA